MMRFFRQHISIPFILSAFFLLCGFAVWNYGQPPRAYHIVNTVPLGADKDEVRRIIGSPQDISSDGSTFYYYRPFACGTLYVIFDKRQKFTKSYYESY